VEAGRQAMRAYLTPKPAAARRGITPRDTTSLANAAAAMILQR
jgi:hypothetical protein